jgi:hypothetical protein
VTFFSNNRAALIGVRPLSLLKRVGVRSFTHYVKGKKLASKICPTEEA